VNAPSPRKWFSITVSDTGMNAGSGTPRTSPAVFAQTPFTHSLAQAGAYPDRPVFCYSPSARENTSPSAGEQPPEKAIFSATPDAFVTSAAASVAAWTAKRGQLSQSALQQQALPLRSRQDGCGCEISLARSSILHAVTVYARDECRRPYHPATFR